MHRFPSLLAALSAGLIVLNALFIFQPEAAASKPNIVIIVADDLGWADVSFHGTEIKTPNLDRLVRQGAELDRFYVCPVCSPTRAGLMTGRYPIRFGAMRAVFPPWREGGLSTKETTLPEVLARAGYSHRGCFGKWHLGHSDVNFHPLRRGFTEFVGHYNGAIDYFTHEREGEVDWHQGYETRKVEGYSTDLIADAAVDFIRRHAKGGSPFLAYVPFNAPHSPFQAKEEDMKRYSHLAGDDRKGKGKGKKGRGGNQRQTLAAMVSCMDQGVGRILDELDAQGVTDNTLVWFFSDNGGTGPGDNRPLRDKKATVFEGGIRVAAAARWPGRIEPGTRITVPLAYIDVLPTLMAVAGMTATGSRALDGVNVLEVLTGQVNRLDRSLYSYIGQGGEAQEKISLSEPRWKLVVNGPRITDASVPDANRQILLFDITADPYEKSDLSEKHPAEVARLMELLKSFRSLQPADAVPPYGQRDPAWKVPKDWVIPGS